MRCGGHFTRLLLGSEEWYRQSFGNGGGQQQQQRAAGGGGMGGYGYNRPPLVVQGFPVPQPGAPDYEQTIQK